MDEEDLLKARLELIEGMDDRHSKRLRRIQRMFFDVLVTVIGGKLKIDNSGAFSSGTNNFSVSGAVSDAWGQVQDEYEDTVAKLINEMLKGSNLTRAYMKFQTSSNERHKRASKAAERLLFDTMGIRRRDGKIALKRNGFFDTIIGDNSIRNELTQTLIKAVGGRSDYNETIRGIENLLKGTDERLGRFERYYNVNVYDSLNQMDRIHNRAFAEELDLRAFRYAGTVIDNTRRFCRKRAGKIFLTEEAEEWKDDPPKAAQRNYNPLRDLGGHNCRHSVAYISDAKAARLRDDLIINEAGMLEKI